MTVKSEIHLVSVPFLNLRILFISSLDSLRPPLGPKQTSCVISLINTKYFFVGLSKVQEGKDSYAPGLNIKKSLCGIAVLNRSDNALVSLLSWPKGKQIFDIQLLPNKLFNKPRFPLSLDINSSQPSLDFYNWEFNK